MVVAYQMLNLMTILLENYTNLSSKHKQHSCCVAFKTLQVCVYTFVYVAQSDAQKYAQLLAVILYVQHILMPSLISTFCWWNIFKQPHAQLHLWIKSRPPDIFQFNVLYYTALTSVYMSLCRSINRLHTHTGNR